MTTMYQTVDDPKGELETQARAKAAARKSLQHKALWLALAAAALILIVVFSNQRNNPAPEGEIASRAERSSYRTALSEGAVDLRRARLRDFATTYPQSRFLPAVGAQLSVLDSYEGRDWAVLKDVIYDPRATRIDKLGAIVVFERAWGASYLGGRDGDIAALRETLEQEPTPAPNRALTDVTSPIPTHIPSTVMVGGPRAITRPAPRPTTRPITPTQNPVRATQLIAPTIRKNVKPRYPRTARRRGIGAVVELSLSIDDKGEVRLAEVVSVQAEKYAKHFVKAAERAAMRTRYTPQLVNGKPTPVSGIKKRYVFRVAD